MSSRRCPPRSGQRGVAALELAMVLIPLLLLLYGIVAYGSLFWVQQTLTRAAEDGARAALQSAQLTDVHGASMLSGDAACKAAGQSVQWLNARRRALGLSDVACSQPAVVACPYAPGNRCLQITVTYQNYQMYPLVPELIPLQDWLHSLLGSQGEWIPRDLEARAWVQLGGA